MPFYSAQCYSAFRIVENVKMFSTNVPFFFMIIPTIRGSSVKSTKLRLFLNPTDVWAFYHNFVFVENILSVHYRGEEGCIGKYIPRGPRDFLRAGILRPKARGQSTTNLVFSRSRSRLEIVQQH